MPFRPRQKRLIHLHDALEGHPFGVQRQPIRQLGQHLIWKLRNQHVDSGLVLVHVGGSRLKDGNHLPGQSIAWHILVGQHGTVRGALVGRRHDVGLPVWPKATVAENKQSLV